MICSILSEGAVTHKTVKKWYRRFRSDKFDISYQARFDQPKIFEDEKVELLSRGNSAQIQQELVAQFKATQEAICHRLNKVRRDDHMSLVGVAKNDDTRRLHCC